MAALVVLILSRPASCRYVVASHVCRAADIATLALLVASTVSPTSPRIIDTIALALLVESVASIVSPTLSRRVAPVVSAAPVLSHRSCRAG
ncbi:hypothetical protein J5X84_34405 [Streptosporangiaceae bacterium NEAU-GS5]|nr:hypothetical protein [Streptosporangiaceae bacterium NEAU-GS5]